MKMNIHLFFKESVKRTKINTDHKGHKKDRNLHEKSEKA